MVACYFNVMLVIAEIVTFWKYIPLGVVHKRRRKGSKIGQNCRRIVLKNCRHGGGGVKNPEKLPTSFMNGPLEYLVTQAKIIMSDNKLLEHELF